MEVKLGPWVRLEGISLNQLPYGGRGIEPSNSQSSSQKYNDGSGSTSAPKLKDFVTAVLIEAVPFIDGVAPKSGGAATWKVKGSPRNFPNSEAPVQSYEYVVSGKDLDKVEGMSQFSADRKDETWFCRRSCHKNAAEQRTASWEEFVHCFKEHHAESEEAFTPTVIAGRTAVTYDTSGMEVTAHGEKWTAIQVAVEEMKHRIDPKPLKNRTFPVVQITAMLAKTQEFIVVSIPINDFDKSPYADYSKDKSLVMAAYSAVERVRVLPGNGDIEWIMATASDAGGILPQWMQNMAVPGAIAKDVELFLSWIPSQRHAQTSASRSDAANKALPIAPAGHNGAPPPISKTEEWPSGGADSINKVLPAAPA